jgi:protocatechuate 3,4-dioxygenase beta subunit
MKLYLLGCLTNAAVLISAQSVAPDTQPQKCKLEGQVLSVSGAPLRKAIVRLQPMNQAGNQPPSTTYTSPTDAEGKFLLEDVTPGTYSLSASRTGYLPETYGAPSGSTGLVPINLVPGQEVKDLVIKLAAQGLIYGKVLDEDGEPVQNFAVQALRWGFLNGKKQLQTNGNQNSQADGSFVMGNLRSGRYYLCAQDQSRNFAGATQPFGNKNLPQESYLKTYFPNAADASSAAPVNVLPGAEVRGIEIRMRRGRVFSIRGKIVNSLGGAIPQSLQLDMVPKNNVGIAYFEMKHATVSSQTASFQFPGVEAGQYLIETYGGGVETRDPTGEFSKFTQLVGRMEVTVTDQDLDSVVLTVAAGSDITGYFKTEGGAPTGPRQQGNTAQKNIRLIATGGFIRGNPYAQVKTDDTFRLKGVPSDVFDVNVNGLPDDTYVKAIRFGGRDLKDKMLDLTTGIGGELEILLSANAAEVTGILRDANGTALPGVRVQIWDKDATVAKAATTDQSGSFRLTGLAPGEYKVFAWEDTMDGIITDPDFRKTFEGQAAAVKLSEKSHENVDVKLITRDAMAAEAAKIQ